MGLKLGAYRDEEGVIRPARVYVPSGYRSPETGQTEKFVTLNLANNATWQTLYTVPTGKTFFITEVMFTDDGAAGRVIKIGKNSTADLLHRISSNTTTHYSFNVPITYSSGVVIQVNQSEATINAWVTVIGWEE